MRGKACVSRSSRVCSLTSGVSPCWLRSAACHRHCVFHPSRLGGSPASSQTTGAIFQQHLFTLYLCITFW